jgi:IclR family acetate operon transcriptional repressor
MTKAVTTLRRGRQRTREEIGVTRALDRGLAVLEALSEAREAALADLARSTGQSPSTTFRMLETLRQRGYVEQSEETALYRIGARAFEVGAGFLRGLEIDRIAPQVMAQLVEDLGETASLAVRDGRDALYLEQIEGRRRIRMATRVGARLPLHATAAGKVLLAWLWEEKIAALIGPGPYRGLTPRTLTTSGALMADLTAVRRRGYAIDDEEYEPDLRCLAAPIRDIRGDVVAALSLSALASRLPTAELGAAAERLMRAADEITLRLGGQPSRPAAAQTGDGVDMFLD